MHKSNRCFWVSLDMLGQINFRSKLCLRAPNFILSRLSFTQKGRSKVVGTFRKLGGWGQKPSKVLARQLKLMTFSRNWGITLVFLKGHHYGQFFFATTHRMLENSILWKKYFTAWHYTTQTNHHWEMIFSLS